LVIGQEMRGEAISFLPSFLLMFKFKIKMDIESKSINIVKEYRATDAINYSSLSALATSPQAYQTKDQIEGIPAFRKGSAVDCLLTTPDDFHSEFYVMNKNKMPSDAMVRYIDEYFKTNDHNKAYIESGYKTKAESIKERFETEGMEYYNALKDSRGKTLLSFDEYEQVQRAVNQILNGEFTKKYFSKQREGVEIFYQYPIYWEIMGQKCKSLLDILVVDHNRKEISPIDLKTTGKSAYYFRGAFIKWKYYLQAAFYTEAVNCWKNKNPKLENYKINNFKFLVVETSGFNPPMIYQANTNDLDIGTNGGFDKQGYRVKGFVQLIDDLCYHEETGNWDFPREMYENNGVAILDTMER